MYGKELSARSISILHSFFFSPLTHLAPLSVFFSVSHLPLCAFPMVLAPGNLYFLASSSLLEPCNLMLLGAFIVVDRREGLTWSSRHVVLIHSLQTSVPSLSRACLAISLHVSGNMAMVSGAYVPLSWRKVTEGAS